MSTEYYVQRVNAWTSLIFIVTLLLSTPTVTLGEPLRDLTNLPAFDTTTLVTVTTTSETVDGITTSFANLNANKGPDGLISLPEAILAANATTSTDKLTITFNIPTSDARYDNDNESWTILLTRAVPPLTRSNVTIDGTTQPHGSGTHPSIVIDGTNMYENVDMNNGITIGSQGNVVRGLTLTNFYDSGILISGPSAANNQIVGCYIGTNATGVQVEPNGTGVLIRDGAHDNIIGGNSSDARNLISGNNYDSGVHIHGATTQYNTIAGNWIGINASGQAALANTFAGIRISGGAYDNTIGGTTSGSGNVIAGNDSGISIEGGVGNIVAGNVIGLAPDGQTILGNRNGGIFVIAGAHHNLIGGNTPEARNIISGNNGQGIYVTNIGSNDNRIQGNVIGSDRTGIQSGLGNRGYGIIIAGNAEANIVGGVDAGTGNVIVYNGSGGIWVASSSNQIAGNKIGLGADGIARLGNQNNGIRVSASNNVIGPFNIIDYNHHSGISIIGSGTNVLNNTIEANDHSGICVVNPNTTTSGNTIDHNGIDYATPPDC